MYNRIDSFIDIEEDRAKKRRVKLFIFSVLISFLLFAYPAARIFQPKWKTLKAGRKLALYLSMLKSRAIVTKTAMQTKFIYPDTIEVSETTGCTVGLPQKKLWDIKLSELESDIVLADAAWVEKAGGQKETVLERFCYDPITGSNLKADGMVSGGIYLVHQNAFPDHQFDQSIEVVIEGENADFTLE